VLVDIPLMQIKFKIEFSLMLPNDGEYFDVKID
jgi:hypothetical protein